jgi:hypothetical protein
MSSPYSNPVSPFFRLRGGPDHNEGIDSGSCWDTLRNQEDSWAGVVTLKEAREMSRHGTHVLPHQNVMQSYVDLERTSHVSDHGRSQARECGSLLPLSWCKLARSGPPILRTRPASWPDEKRTKLPHSKSGLYGNSACEPEVARRGPGVGSAALLARAPQTTRSTPACCVIFRKGGAARQQGEGEVE